ncbi:MAG: type II toxin-antitoxin system RelE/ParE family toxin [Thiomargarita sp.]|nr:type II toxin-antitoxin system RelE/ParE family toxin [Thiomargarita sp.]
MKKWNIIYYEDNENNCPFLDFYSKLSVNNEKAKVMSWLEQLEINGPTLPRPYADLLRDGIHELRIKLTGDQHRILYFLLLW